ncbi:MAG: transcriptional repressor [Candidatus Omnitrophica bacterium]|nr:transcriptional repressor [Candidatus Omnitrophota bacterium]
MQEHKEIFNEYLKQKDLRHTPERDVILDEVYAKDGHFDIDSLFIRLRKNYPDKRISKASIYRNIPLFIKAGLVRESITDGSRSFYEHVLGHTHHDHMSCVRCGKITEFYDKKIDKIQEEFCKKSKFEILWHTHVIYGLCGVCSKRKDKK